jgi:bacterioferritin-associated ferredoxin
MTITQLCPQCGTVAYPVPSAAVQAHTREPGPWDSAAKWFACTNKNCAVAYSSKGRTVYAADLDVSLWYKDDRDNVPVCYCSKLTRGEIKNAVRKGYRTIDEVQEFTGKNITGRCITENPLGECCRNVFLRTIQESIA